MEELKDKKILVLGSQGMAGHIIMAYLQSKGYHYYGVSRTIYQERDCEDAFDVSDYDALKTFISKRSFDIVINAVGVLIGDSVADYKRAIELNGLLPQILHQWSLELSFKLVLISTDCVFDGKIGAYSEWDVPNANDPYGYSKRLGEAVQDVRNTLIIRTSIIGPELKSGTGLWHWFESQVGTIMGYANVYWSGVTTLELAHFIEFALIHNLNGLVQLTNGIPISKFELLQLMRDMGVNPRVDIKSNSLPVSNKSLIASDLKGYRVKGYRDMIREQMQFQVEKNS